jgi:hypothetical protein
MKNLTDDKGKEISLSLINAIDKQISSITKSIVNEYSVYDIDRIISSALTSILCKYIHNLIKDEFMNDKIDKAEELLSIVKKSLYYLNRHGAQSHTCSKECAEEIH